MKSSSALAPALAASARLLERVAHGKSLMESDRGAVPAELRAAVIDLTQGTLRRYGRGPAVVERLSERRPLPRVEALIWAALYALESGRYAEYTVVSQAVAACGLLEAWPAKGYVNALLRRFLRERTQLEQALASDPEFRYQHPRWWIDELKAAYPDWEAVLAAGNGHPPMTLRVNRRRQARGAYLERLEAAAIHGVALGEEGILVEQPVPVARLPGFEAGDVSVQDLGAQRAAHCLALAPGQRVLDACAAPGGKSAHILELAEVDLVALDSEPARVQRLAENLARLGLRADVRTADCLALDAWWDGRTFDRILADVPCSASGIARRRPDTKWLRRHPDLEAFARLQGNMLDALWRVLSPGGKLLYATCSVFPSENKGVVDAFLRRTPRAEQLPLPDGGAAQWLPGPRHDGFFYALISKTA